MRASYGIQISYNDAPGLVQYSPDRGGVSVHLHNTDDGELALKAQTNVMNEIQRYWLRGLRVGDTLSFRYIEGVSEDPATDLSSDDGACGWDQLERQALPGRPIDQIADGHRLGLDVGWRDRAAVRCAYPQKGGFSLIITNAPVTTMRGFVMAGNERESWSWEFADLHPGETCRVTLVATDRWDKPHRTVAKP